MSPPNKTPLVRLNAVDERAARLNAAFPPCTQVSCFLAALFPVSRCRRVGAMVAFLLSVVAIHHSAATTPYLRAVGPPDLRFQKRVAFVQAKKLPLTGGGEPSPEAKAAAAAATEAANQAAAITETKPAEVKDPAQNAPGTAPPPPATDVRPILNDTFAPRLVPEEVLPFFILPQSTPERSTSSATYKQQ